MFIVGLSLQGISLSSMITFEVYLIVCNHANTHLIGCGVATVVIEALLCFYNMLTYIKYVSICAR